MAEIATYTCSNSRCKMVVRLSRDFPVWHVDTPPQYRDLAVAPHAAPYVLRYRSESFCSTCFKVVDRTESNTCTVCTTAVVVDPMGHPCPRCNQGTLVMPQLKVF
jgi:hypothetical protein